MPSDAEYLRKRLAGAFAKLPPVLRDAYTLFQVTEMPIHEIARQTGVTENLVNNVRYKVEEYTGLEVVKINIYVEGVRVID